MCLTGMAHLINPGISHISYFFQLISCLSTMFPEEQRSPVSPSRCPFPWCKDPEDSVNPKVTPRFQVERNLEVGPFTGSAVGISPHPRGATDAGAECQLSTLGTCASRCDDAHITQPLHGTQGSSSTLNSGSLNFHTNPQAFHHRSPLLPTGSHQPWWGHPNLLSV